MRADIAQTIRSFINDNFCFRDDTSSIKADESLLEAGLIDSTGILELVSFLENEFALVIADADIVPENLDSIAAITAYAERKLGAKAAAA
jgi:acyl carrier protein